MILKTNTEGAAQASALKVHPETVQDLLDTNDTKSMQGAVTVTGRVGGSANDERSTVTGQVAQVHNDRSTVTGM